MISYKHATVEVPSEITCDICGKTYNMDRNENEPEDDFEIQEFHHINFTGGYTSVFGDENKVTCDICQHCLKEKLGQYLIITEYEF